MSSRSSLGLVVFRDGGSSNGKCRTSTFTGEEFVSLAKVFIILVTRKSGRGRGWGGVQNKRLGLRTPSTYLTPRRPKMNFGGTRSFVPQDF